jgi:predicted nuclease with TOPRIM domain
MMKDKDRLLDELEAENDRLREALKDYQARVIPAETQVVELEAETYRLREALEIINNWSEAHPHILGNIGVIARAALKEAGK